MIDLGSCEEGAEKFQDPRLNIRVNPVFKNKIKKINKLQDESTAQGI